MDILSGPALAQVQQMIRDYYGQARGTSPDGPPPRVAPGPEVFIAKSPAGGIPARVGNTPGTALCDLYEARQDSFGSTARTLTALTLPNGDANQRQVDNLSTTAIEGSAYIAIVRDKFGCWVPVFEEC
jgi:hypothetical protein